MGATHLLFHNQGRGKPIGGGIETYIDKILKLSPIAYWPLNELNGTTAVNLISSTMNGTYARDVATMGTITGIGDGGTAPVFDATNDRINIQTVALTTAFASAAAIGWLASWGQVSGAGVWTDSTKRTAIILHVDGENRNYIEKYSDDNEVRYFRRAGNSPELYDYTTAAPTNWFHLCITWNYSLDTINYYYDGAPIATDGGLVAWVGALTISVIGAASTLPAQPWSGSLAHVVIGAGTISNANILTMASV